MGIFLKQMLRKPIRAFTIALLLAFSVGLLIIGYGAWDSARVQLASIDNSYTTIALLKPESSYTDQDESSFIIYSDVIAAAENAPGVIGFDNRCLLSAHIDGSKGLASGSLNELDYNKDLDGYAYSLSVLALRCISVEDATSNAFMAYMAAFQLEDAVCRMEAYDLPPENDTVYVSSSIYKDDGTIPFEPGKTYLVRGFYEDYTVLHSHDGPYREVNKPTLGSLRFLHPDDMYLCPKYVTFSDGETYFMEGQPGMNTQFGELNGNTYRYAGEDDLPYFTEYTGSWEDFLETQDGRIWREKIIPMCQLNHSSVAVMLTDNLESLYVFNTKNGDILEGRGFYPADYETGSRVCLVSASYAQLNGLSVGDMLELDFYNTGYQRVTADSNDPYSEGGSVIQRVPMLDQRIDFKDSYKIIGIYTAPTHASGSHLFQGDMIFVPKASVPSPEKYEDHDDILLNSVILENGSADTFEAYMSKQGYSNLFLYFDQNYSAIQKAAEALAANAQRLFFISGAIFVLTAALFLYLNLRRMKPVAHSMRLLGQKKLSVWVGMSGSTGVLILLAVLLGYLLGSILFASVTESVLSATIAINQSSIIVCVVMQMAVLMIASLIGSSRLAAQNLMQRRKQK